MMSLNQKNLSFALMAAVASVFSLAPAALSDSPLDGSLETLSSGANSAAAVFIEEDVTAAAAAFGEAGAAAIASEQGAVAQGTSYFGEIEVEYSEEELGAEESDTESLDISAEFYDVVPADH